MLQRRPQQRSCAHAGARPWCSDSVSSLPAKPPSEPPPMAFQQPHVPPGPSGKLPIPRLDRPRDPPKKPAAPRQARVPRACLSCRARKIKCNGAQPKCQNCTDNAAAACVYAASRKDRLKTSVHSLSCPSAVLLIFSAPPSTTRTCSTCSRNYARALHPGRSRRSTTYWPAYVAPFPLLPNPPPDMTTKGRRRRCRSRLDFAENP